MHLCDATKVNRFGPIGTTLLRQEMKSLGAAAVLICRLRRKTPASTTKGGRADMMLRHGAALLKVCANQSRTRPSRTRRALAARGESPASHRGRRGAPMVHPTAHSPRRGDPGGAARRPQSGAPTVRPEHGGVQYREYLREEQRRQPGAPAARFPARWGGAGMHRRPNAAGLSPRAAKTADKAMAGRR
jgi:hypothetical protein